MKTNQMSTTMTGDSSQNRKVAPRTYRWWPHFGQIRALLAILARHLGQAIMADYLLVSMIRAFPGSRNRRETEGVAPLYIYTRAHD